MQKQNWAMGCNANFIPNQLKQVKLVDTGCEHMWTIQSVWTKTILHSTGDSCWGFLPHGAHVEKLAARGVLVPPHRSAFWNQRIKGDPVPAGVRPVGRRRSKHQAEPSVLAVR